MQVPVKFFWPYRVDPEASISFTIETEISGAKFIANPVLRFYNTSAGTMHLKVEHTLDLGFGDDPLYSGTWTFDVVDEDVTTLTYRDVTFSPQIDNDTTVATRHTVTVTNPDTEDERIIQFVLFGTTDISTRLPANQEIVR